MGKRVHYLLVCIFCFHFISWIFAGTRTFYQMPTSVTQMDESHIPVWKSQNLPISSITASGRQQFKHPPNDDDYDDEDDDSDEDDENSDEDDDQDNSEDEANKKKEIKKKKTKVEKIQDFKDKVVDKYLDIFLQIETKEPPDPPKEETNLWGPPPDIEKPPPPWNA